MSETNDSKIRQSRKKGIYTEWKENPKMKFFELRREKITEGQFVRESGRINRFELFINQHQNIPDEVGLRDVVDKDVYLYLEESLVPDEDIGDKTLEGHLRDLNYFYKTLVAHNAIDDNPVYKPHREGDGGALDSVRSSDEFDTEKGIKRPFVPMGRMKTFLAWIDSPKIQALHLTGLKTACRSGTIINLDLRCVHIAHPLYYQLLDEHDVELDQRIVHKPDSILFYEQFHKETEIPNEDRLGPDQGEVRGAPCKRKEKNGSVIPIDSELKTTLIEWALIRPQTPNEDIHPFFTKTGTNGDRMDYNSFNYLWYKDMEDSIRRFGKRQALDKCPTCGGEVTERNPTEENPGRHYNCNDCGERYWRSIMWDSGLETPQKYTFHCHRNYCSDAHRPDKSELTENVMNETVRKYKVRGDSPPKEDADRLHYSHPENLNWETDVRQPYLNEIYKFNLYDDPIPAVVGDGAKNDARH